MRPRRGGGTVPWAPPGMAAAAGPRLSADRAAGQRLRPPPRHGERQDEHGRRVCRRSRAGSRPLARPATRWDIRNRLLASRPDDEILQVEVIEAMSRLDATQAMERALAMAAKPSADGAVKLRLAVLLSYNSRQKDAVRLARQALTLGADPVACRVCLVRSLAALKDFGGAAAEMTALLSQDIPALECRELSDSALVIGRPDLAVQPRGETPGAAAERHRRRPAFRQRCPSSQAVPPGTRAASGAAVGHRWRPIGIRTGHRSPHPAFRFIGRHRGGGAGDARGVEAVLGQRRTPGPQSRDGPVRG